MAHRPLTRRHEDVRSISDYVEGIHYVPYSKTPFFKQLNELQGTPDVDKVPIEEFAKARKKLFKEQPKEDVKVKDLIATQPVVNGDKVKRNVKDEKIKDLFVVRYKDQDFVMDGHHALAAAGKLGKKKVCARVLHLEPEGQEFYREDQSRDASGRFADEGKGSQEPGYVHPGELPIGAKLQPKSQFIPVKRSSAPVVTPADMEFYSPNTGEMGFATAQAKMDSPDQDVARAKALQIDRALGMSAISYNAIGDWQDGAENSVVTELNNVKDFAELRYNAALKGKALNQKAVLAFKVDKDGKDAVHSMTVATGNLAELRNRLTNAGIQHRTLIPDGPGNTHVVVVDIGNSLGNNVGKVADHYGTRATTIRGTAEFVGEADTRSGAQANYDKIIQGYERSYADRRHYRPDAGQGTGDYGREVGTSHLTQKVTSTQVGDGGSSDVFITTFTDGTKGVWKPESGEGARRENVPHPHYPRETAAYQVGNEVGLKDMMPETITRKVATENGSMQEFVPNADNAYLHDRTERYDGKTDLARAAAFDWLIGNTDRNSSNWMLSGADAMHIGKIHLIDNGASFPDNTEVDWDGNRAFVDEAINRDLPIPDEAKHWVDHLPKIEAIMKKNGLTDEEVAGVYRRAHQLENANTFGDFATKPMGNLFGAYRNPEDNVKGTPSDSVLKRWPGI